MQTARCRPAAGSGLDLAGRQQSSESLDLPGGEGIALELQQVKEFPSVIVVAGGVDKELAVLGALRQRFIKVLVTDYKTGLTVVDPPQ